MALIIGKTPTKEDSVRLQRSLTVIDAKKREISDNAAKIDEAALLNNTFINLATDCSSIYETIKNRAFDEIKSYLSKPVRMSTMEENVTELRNALNTYIQNVLNAQKAIEAAIAANESAKDALSDDDLKVIDDIVKEVKDFQKDNKVETLINNLEKLSERYFTFITKPIKPKKDEVEVNIDITADKLNCTRSVPVNYNQTYEVKGGWKLDFSTGIFFSAGNHDFKGRDLEYLPVIAADTVKKDTVTINDKNGSNGVMISIGALAHFYRRTDKNIHIAFSPGVSTTLKFDAVNIHLGVSGIFGRENRGIITIGAVLRQSTVLRKGYEYNKEYAKAALPDTPPTTTVFPKAGGFIAFTYNISKFQK